MPTVRTCAHPDMGSMSVCVCPAFTVLGGKKTKKEGHHKEILDIFSSVNRRKGHRSVLPPPPCVGHGRCGPCLWCLYPRCGVLLCRPELAAGSLTAAPRPLQQRASPDTPALQLTLPPFPARGDTTLAKFHRAWRWRRPVSSVLIVCSFQQGEGPNRGFL